MQIDIKIIIYFYMFICVSLLVFNLMYMFHSKRDSRQQIKRIHFWKEEIERQISFLYYYGIQESRHTRLLHRKLKSVTWLMAHLEAVREIKEYTKEKERLNGYLRKNYLVFQGLAVTYAKKDSMDKAYFAYVMSIYRVNDGKTYDMLMDVLISYMQNSTVYCRENVLCSLYRMGNPTAVEKALRMLNDSGEFHHPKLLADGLLTFAGDKEALASSLWKHRKVWNTNILIALLQFIRSSSGHFTEPFYKLLKDLDEDLEVRLGIIRYFRKYKHEEAHQLLLSYVSDIEVYGDEIAALSAASLENYPGSATLRVLERALSNRNWHVRRNAAASFVYLCKDPQIYREILEGEDRFAKEILQYTLQWGKTGKEAKG